MRLNWRWLAVFTILAMLVGACSAGETASSTTDSGATAVTTSSPEEGPTTSTTGTQPEQELSGDLRFTIWSNAEPIIAEYERQIAEFKALHPGVGEITIEPVPYQGYAATISTQIAGGNPPDAGWLQPEKDGGQFISSGALVDISETLQSDPSYEYEDILPSLMAPWTEGDAIYGYPFSNAPTIVFYNEDLLAEADQPTPREMLEAGTWTWEELRPVLKQVGDLGPNIYGFAIRDWENFSEWQALRYIWAGWGADPWTDGGSTCTWADQPMVDAMSYYHDLVFEDGSAPQPGSNPDFLAGQVGIFLGIPGVIGQLADVDFEWDVIRLPAGPAGANSTFGAAGLVAFSAGENQELAKEWVKFASNPENSEAFASRFSPPRESLIEASILSEANGLSEERNQEVIVDALKNGSTLPQIRGDFAAVFEATRTALGALWEPNADVAVGLQDVCATIEPLLP